MQNDKNILSEFYQTIDLPMNDVFSVYHYTSISALKCIIEIKMVVLTLIKLP